MLEKTLAGIKPDGFEMGVTEQIKERYVTAGLRIVREKTKVFTKSEAQEFYLEHVGKCFFIGAVLSMASGPSVWLVLEGENAINTVRALNGATNPAEAAPGTIRCDFRRAGGPLKTF